MLFRLVPLPTVKLLQACWQALLHHPLRSFLTALGMVIAVAGVTAIVAVTAGMNQTLVKNFSQLGTETLLVRSNLFKALNKQQLQPMTVRDWHALQNLQPGISTVVAFGRVSLGQSAGQGVLLRYQQRSQAGRLLASSANLPQMTGRYPSAGRFFTDDDSAARRRVALVSAELAGQLGLADDITAAQPLAQLPLLQVGDYQLRVIGIMPGGNRDILGTSADVYLPLGLAQQMNGNELALEFGFRSLDAGATADIRRQVSQLLRQVQRTAPGEAANFVIESAAELIALQTNTLDMVRRVLLLVVAIALLVGCIGIMNVMLASVSERTREIGLLRALGASRGYIQSRVLLESAWLSVGGSLAGIVLGYALAWVIIMTLPAIETVVLPPLAVLLTVASAVLVGLCCGALPARRAAALTPLAALNME